MAMNAMPGIRCGLTNDPVNAFAFTQINAGNCAAVPFGKGLDWGGKIGVRYIFESLFTAESGGGYPPEAADAERFNRGVLGDVKAISQRDMNYILKNLDEDMLRMTFADLRVRGLFSANCTDDSYVRLVRDRLGRPG